MDSSTDSKREDLENFLSLNPRWPTSRAVLQHKAFQDRTITTHCTKPYRKIQKALTALNFLKPFYNGFPNLYETVYFMCVDSCVRKWCRASRMVGLKNALVLSPEVMQEWFGGNLCLVQCWAPASRSQGILP